MIVPPEARHDEDPTYNAGDTKLVVDENLNVVEDFAILGGTDTNCAGGVTLGTPGTRARRSSTAAQRGSSTATTS